MRTARSALRHHGTDDVLVMDHVDGNSRSAVAAVRALAAAGYRPLVTTSGGSSSAGASRYCGGVVRSPRTDSPGFRDAVRRYLADRPGTHVLPASDAVLVALELPGAHLVDKAVLPKRAESAGIRVPETLEFSSAAELLDRAGELEYPIVVKSAVKTRKGDTALRVDSARELSAARGALVGPVVVQPFATGTMRAVCGVVADGEILAVVHQRYERIWPAECGTASAAVTTEPDLDLEARLPELLSGHEGVFQVQLVGDLAIDVNPRVYGSLPLAVAAGANLPAIACAVRAGRRGTGVVRGRPGVRYRWLEGDLRRVVHGLRTGDTTVGAAGRALLPRPGTAHSIESLRDPGPALVRAADVVRRALS